MIGIEIEDRRGEPATVSIDLRILRYLAQYFRGRNYDMVQRHTVAVRTRNHIAESRIAITTSSSMSVKPRRSWDIEGRLLCDRAIESRQVGVDTGVRPVR